MNKLVIVTKHIELNLSILLYNLNVVNSGSCPAQKGALWTFIKLGLKFVYLISLAKECIMDLYGVIATRFDLNTFQSPYSY